MVLLIIEYQKSKKYINLDPVSWQNFQLAVCKKFQGLSCNEFLVQDTEGVDIEEDIFEVIVPEKKYFIIRDNNDTSSAAETITCTPSYDISSLTLSQLERESFHEKRYSPQELSPKQMVEDILRNHHTGPALIREYEEKGTLMDSSRRTFTKILANDILNNQCEREVVTSKTKMRYAEGAVAVFPSLKDPFSVTNGQETFFDPRTHSGFLEWELKRLRRLLPNKKRKVISKPSLCPTKKLKARESEVPEESKNLSTEDEERLVSWLKHEQPVASTHEEIKRKMKLTIRRRDEIRATQAEVMLQEFPRFLDTPGLIEQDFALIYPEKANRLIESWTKMQPIIIEIAKENLKLSSLPLLQKAIQSLNENDDKEYDAESVSFLALLHLLPPPGGKGTQRISVEKAFEGLIVFRKPSTPLTTICERHKGKQPFLVALGNSKTKVDEFYLIINNCPINLYRRNVVQAMDVLFKSHFVFSTHYERNLNNFYAFLQTYVYNISTECKVSPRVKELRSKFRVKEDQ